ncbi:molybdopterin-dependent oxidoreductase [Thermomicrobium sp. CFH 73360]|uniref:molybdopterin-dependent oxidoreductase n=1 Tax=Thermomicrobium sp. CFH 73360 TaxID=2951987 RepID=UPI0020767B92|nr:molybdopterin-dependent oxidoreductase [Thermomicrobium sp. CFH 73360]MCM8745029.1 molybdopterin-dependent oxidoreductase [Thermomicrobium sp. CFH 73360]
MERRKLLAAFWTGATIGLIWGVVQLVLEVIFGVGTFLHGFLELSTRLIPVETFGWILGVAEASAKPLALLLILVVLALTTGGFAVLLVRWPRSRRWSLSLLAAGTALGTFIVALGRGGSLFVSGLVAAGLTLVLVGGLAAFTADNDAPLSLQRRQLLRVLVAGGLLLSLGAAGRLLSALQVRSRPRGTVDARGLPPALTPVGDFYVVSKNLSDPMVDGGTWRLRIHGRVTRALELDLATIRTRPSTRMISTLECISNDVWGPYISTGEWIGVPLRDLLLEAEPQHPVVEVILRAADGYSDSIPLSLALQPSVLLAYGLNGQTLPPEHGFPLRLVVPGIYGMKNVKWITEIELSDTDYFGFWQQRGWSDTAVVQIHSRIDVPRGGSVLPIGQDVFVGGIAFAGDRGIARVELSTDGGTTWQDVEREAPLSRFSWVRWWTMWRPTVPGRYRLVVRAWDGTGALQEEQERPPLPEGATGFHRITVEVRAAA